VPKQEPLPMDQALLPKPTVSANPNPILRSFMSHLSRRNASPTCANSSPTQPKRKPSPSKFTKELQNQY